MPLETVDLPVSELEPHPQNAKKHDLDVLKKSIARFGQYRSIVVQTPRGKRKRHRILAGHGTYYALRELGYETVSVHPHDIDDDTALRIVAVDNRSTELGGWDDEALVAMLGSLPDLDDTGYTQRDFDQLQKRVMDEFEAGDDGDDGPMAQSYGVVVELQSEDEQAQAIEALVAIGFEPRALYA